MPSNIVALVYICLAISAGWVLARSCFPGDRVLIGRIAACWLTMSIALFLSFHPAMFMLVAALILIAFAPRNDVARLQFYCAALAIVPMNIAWEIPFPGLESLYTLRYPVLLALFVLLPILLKKRLARGARLQTEPLYSKAIGFGIAYIVLISLLDFRLTSFTNGMRNTLDHGLSYGLLILAFSRVMQEPGAWLEAIKGLMLGGVFVLFIGLAQDATYWLLYSEVSDNLRLFAIRYDLVMQQRAGGLRIMSTMSPIPFGIVMAICVGVCVIFLATGQATKFTYLLIALLIFATYRSGSRGAIVLLLVAVMAYVALSPTLRKVRRLLAVPALIVALGTIFLTDLVGVFLELDEHGTFMYRWELILNSMDSISRYPVFGTPDFLQNPFLELSRGGDGLIDIVNAYLAQVLKYGLVGLTLFAMPLVLSMRLLLKYRETCEVEGRLSEEHEARTMLAIFIGFAVAIFTVSLVHHLPQLYWTIVGLSLGVPVRAWKTRGPAESLRAQVPASNARTRRY